MRLKDTVRVSCGQAVDRQVWFLQAATMKAEMRGRYTRGKETSILERIQGQVQVQVQVQMQQTGLIQFTADAETGMTVNNEQKHMIRVSDE